MTALLVTLGGFSNSDWSSLIPVNMPRRNGTQRNSSLMLNIWKQRMTKGEIDAVKGVVSEFGFGDYVNHI